MQVNRDRWSGLTFTGSRGAENPYANIRRVSSVHCETKTQIPQHHKSIASDCVTAKHELTYAKTDEAVTLAAKKVRILCED